MNLFIENYAQLFAIAAPVLTLVAMNCSRARRRARHPLLPSRGTSRRPARAKTVRHHRPRHRGGAANDPDFRRAASAHPRPAGPTGGRLSRRQTFHP